MSPINVFVSYADSFVGKRVLSQFQQFPSTYHVYGCTWDSAAAEKLSATSGCANVSQTSELCAASVDAAAASPVDNELATADIADELDRHILCERRDTLTPGETSGVNVAPLPDGAVTPGGAGSEPNQSDNAASHPTTTPTSPIPPPFSPAAPAISKFFCRHDVGAMRAALLACDWIIVELRQAQTVLELVQFLQLQTSFARPKRLVLLSSLMTWYATPALTAAGADGGEGEDSRQKDDLSDEDAAGGDDDGSEGDAETPYPPAPPQPLERILQMAQDVAQRAVVDAMRGGSGGGVTEDASTNNNSNSNEDEDGEATDDAAAEVLTEDQYNRRVPHLHYMSWRDAEKAVAAAHHAKGLPLDTFVVCSGLPYGGEEDVLEPLFRLAWSAQPEKEAGVGAGEEAHTPSSAADIPATTAVLPIFGNGSQRVPLVHVQDLACFVRKLLRCPSASLPFPERRYLFATDGTNSNSWTSIVGGVNCMFGGRCAMQPVPPQSYPLYRDVDKFTLNLRVEAESMKALMELQDDREGEEEHEGNTSSDAVAAAAVARLPNTWVAEGGLHRHLRAVAHEFAVARGVSPLRIALVGPPLVGKTYLASRLSRYYRLPCVSLDSVVADYMAALRALRNRVETTKAAVLQAERARRVGIKRRRAVARQQREWDAFVEGAAVGGNSAPDGAGDTILSDAEEAADDRSSNDIQGRREMAVVAMQNEVAANTLELTPAEEEEVTHFVQDWWAEQPQVQAWNNKIGEMERVLLLRLHPRPPTPDANPKRRAAGGNAGGGGGNKRKANAGKDAQKSKEEEEELLQLKASLQTAPFQPRALTLMLRWRLAQPDCCVQGFVLDGVPATLELARMVFGEDTGEMLQPPATEEEALKPRYAGEAAAAITAGGGADGEEKGEGGAGVAGPAAAKEPANDVRLPDHVVVLQASDAYLLSRMRSMGVEAERQASSAATINAAGSADFVHTASAAMHAVDVEVFQQDLQTYKREYEEATYSVLSYWECAAAAANIEGMPKTERRAEVHLVTVEDQEPLVPPPPPTSMFAEVPLGSTEQMLRQVIIGPPHNFGKSLEEVQRDAVRQRCLQEEEERAYAEQVAAQAAAESTECAQEQSTRNAEDEKLAELKKADLAELEERKKPMARYLQERVLPLLHKGLLEACAVRPEDPVDFLAEWLIRHNPHDDTFCDV
ncbi:hypothetical protein ABL78_1239 [Leptomonas seymouri]|uniref:Uncharacterized protein n=1 Tax=Leptomonas seymouri TaxID=5684 RepID=A0A0N1IAY4_LEPSE|nr:hypothetical protein ABL78_1239 [Leptomonas seymouri]|eukprot:KPI89658.1 hypothetical protein ABL78_1239 [Leptomonas seymouri]